ncbi:neural-cadherin [Frankliniella occidentalis]|uniref:Neural-cadherin n=1 Tax=Frankliniella occidentalis TaxID=133901 RepID=A0A9C6WYY8_FRAOC|nr:neural-cadherin [Frankliniella occidentalis]
MDSSDAMRRPRGARCAVASAAALLSLLSLLGQVAVGSGVSVLPHDAQPGYTVRRFTPPPVHEVTLPAVHDGLFKGPFSMHHPGAVVSAGAPRSRHFRLLDTGFSQYFAVLDSGELMTTADLSPLINRPVNLVVLEETANSTATHTLHLYVMDRGEVPRFPKEVYEGGSILENLPAGAHVEGVPALVSHGHGAGGAQLQYSIVDGNIGGAFALEQVFVEEDEHPGILEGVVSGVLGAWRRASSTPVGVRLITTKPLDREQVAAYTLTVQAQDAVGVSRARTQVRVAVLDENDNRPVFVSTDYHFSVFADNMTSPRGRFLTIGQVAARDADGDHVAYSLSQPSGLVVVVPQTGELLLVSDPPRDAEVEFFVDAHDVRHPDSLTAERPARVRVDFHSDRAVDLNMVDLPAPTPPPQHRADKLRRAQGRPRHRTKRRTTRAVRPTKKIEFGESDGETEGRIVFALDRDSDRETFKIRDPNPWVTVDADGSVRVKKKWDYEELAPEKVIDFWVIISNQGDAPEERTRQHGQHHGTHGHGHHQQANAARLADREKNSEYHFIYSLCPARPNFATSRIAELELLSSESLNNKPSCSKSYTDSQRVIIHVKDVNDEAPYFINRPLPMQAVVQLNAPPNTPVFTLQARDPDTDHNIHYFIVRDRTGGRFEVDERSGVVRTRGTDLFQLDMEYVLYVRAEDQNGRVDGHKFQSTPEERLSIVGGKRAPQFYMPSYEAEIPENQKKDSDIISVKAKSFADRDIRYTLKAQGQGAGTFNIGASNGIVKLAKELDFEDLRQPHVYSLIVTATEDSGGFSTTVGLTIRVTDVNDNAPKFELPDYQAHSVDEDIPLGTSILKVKATDADSGQNAELEYEVSDDHFSIDAAGVVSNNKQLDADNNNAYYEFTVTAKDKGEPAKTGTATIRVYTKNKNDEEPKFSQQVYTPNVDENAGPNTLVTTVVASDKDGDNVRFGFVGGGTVSGQFVIEEITGVIRLHGQSISLERDKYELNVTAMDDGSCCVDGDQTKHTSTAVVVVFITDVNDNKPVFKDCGTYYPKVEEGAPNSTPVIKVHATDDDKGVNGQVKYSIVQQPNQKGTKFMVNEETGEVLTNKVFDREGDDGKFVSVTVKATDQGDPSLEGVCSFTVEISDVNDNPPLFDRQKYVENVKQDASIGTNILRVSASDEDADNNGAIIYTLSAPVMQSDIEYFEIQPESGWIVLKKPLDKETYKLEATATDKGYPPLTRTVEVQIEVVDRANNPPIWDHVQYGPVFIKENTAVGAKVISVKASSGIEGNPTVYYRLMPGSTAQTNKFHTFYLQQRADNGNTWADIKVNHPLDYESIKEYNLTIRVENNGAQQLASEATVHIQLEDVNDEIPLFTEREQELVLEGEPIGTRVTQINAIDKDGTYPNNQVYYYVVDSPRNLGKDFFEINMQTGEVFTRIVFDREKQGAYALEVEARDGAPSARPNSGGQPNSGESKRHPHDSTPSRGTDGNADTAYK